MASRNGSANVTPAPFSTVLREICFLKMNMGIISSDCADYCFAATFVPAG